jgi:hypothetical protein
VLRELRRREGKGRKVIGRHVSAQGKVVLVHGASVQYESYSTLLPLSILKIVSSTQSESFNINPWLTRCIKKPSGKKLLVYQTQLPIIHLSRAVDKAHPLTRWAGWVHQTEPGVGLQAD